MVGTSIQSWTVAATVAGAVVYLGWSAWRRLRRRGTAACCERGCAAAPQSPQEAKGGSSGQAFIPLENVADLARRHSEQRGPEAETREP